MEYVQAEIENLFTFGSTTPVTVSEYSSQAPLRPQPVRLSAYGSQAPLRPQRIYCSRPVDTIVEVEEKPGPIGGLWENVLEPVGTGLGTTIASPFVFVGGVVASGGAAVGAAGYGIVTTARGFMGIVPFARDTVNTVQADWSSKPEAREVIPEYRPAYTSPSVEFATRPTYVSGATPATTYVSDDQFEYVRSPAYLSSAPPTSSPAYTTTTYVSKDRRAIPRKKELQSYELGVPVKIA